MDYDKLIDRLNTKLQSYAAYTDSEFAHVMEDAITAIEVLRADLARVTAERDAAVADLYYTGGCPTCKLNRGKSDRTGIPICTKKVEYPTGECYEWRGEVEVYDGHWETD